MIRKIIVTLIIALTVVAGGQAQKKPFKKELLIGGSFGANFSKISFAVYKVNTKMKLGYSGGVSVRWITEKNLGLQGEINFTQYGWDEQFEDTKYKYTRTINYVEIPFLTHIYFGSDRFRAFVNLGPKIGYALSESTDENLNGASPNIENQQHNLAVQKRFDWGICGGPGMELRTGIGSFQLEGRYYYGLSDIFNSRKEDRFSKSSNQVISVKLTYMFSVIK